MIYTFLVHFLIFDLSKNKLSFYSFVNKFRCLFFGRKVNFQKGIKILILLKSDEIKIFQYKC